MGDLRSTGFVGADTLELIPWPGQIVMVGDIGCLGDLRLSVEKYLRVITPGADSSDAIDGRDLDITVQTYVYSYHASVCDHGGVFRYDNNHPRPGHADWHHVHRSTGATPTMTAVLFRGWASTHGRRSETRSGSCLRGTTTTSTRFRAPTITPCR